MYKDLRNNPMLTAEYRKHASDAEGDFDGPECDGSHRTECWGCTRKAGHTGDHVAYGSRYVAAWDESENRYSDG